MPSDQGGRSSARALRHFDVDQTVRLFEAEGVATKVEGNGKIFPVSDRAADVLDPLRRLNRSGAICRGQSAVRAIERRNAGPGSDPGFVITLATRADGSTGHRRGGRPVLSRLWDYGDGYAIARSLAIPIVEPRPALVPIRVETDWVPSLRGLSLPDVIASVHVGRRANTPGAPRGDAVCPFRPERAGDPRRQPGRGPP